MKDSIGRRVSFAFLCAAPFVASLLAGSRALRIAGVHETIGVLMCAAIIAAGCLLAGSAALTKHTARQPLALAGVLLVLPFALVSLFWVGLSGPWAASPSENVMRYVVLTVMSVAVTCGFVVLHRVLSDMSERLYSTIGFATNLLAGIGYLVWLSFAVGFSVLRVRDGHAAPTLVSVAEALDPLLFFSCILTYATTALFAMSLGRSGLLTFVTASSYVTLNIVALLFLAMRGLSYPDPNGPTPWYMRPGFVVGIPAIPWLMPSLLGVLMLRRAGDLTPTDVREQESSAAAMSETALRVLDHRP